jgi:C4-dicarboxylate-specific signal transduction histidine kinase
MTNDQLMMMAIAVIAVLLVVVAWLFLSRRRTLALRDRFGPEYDHVRHSSRTTAEAERTLEERERRVETFSIRALSREEAERFAATWRNVQAEFVDDPRGAVIDADRLITDVMRTRGYPVDDPDRRLDDLSVGHAQVVSHYRAGRAIVVRHERGEASTEDLRQAMVHFRALFDELVAGELGHVRRAS